MSTAFSSPLPEPPPLAEGTLRIVPLGGPGIHARGVAEGAQVIERIRPEIITALEQALAEQGERRDPHQLQLVMLRVVGRHVGRRLRRRPMIIPLVIES
jgi:ribonuclease J